MRTLFDYLPGHEVEHVVDMGWSSKRNGELLELMVANEFAGFVPGLKSGLGAARHVFKDGRPRGLVSA
ncbi:MAG: hypothetical protein ACREXU_13950 [Gammaproteobacteria bacterium]